MDQLNQILHGDCLELLKQLPGECVDSCVSDVPYGLGKKEPTPEEILQYLQGADLNMGGDFMGKDWDIPSIPVWKEVYRVLKPGSYLTIFGGTRTFDLISMGLRMAGFICRDTIADEFPAHLEILEHLGPVEMELPILQWVYSSGMPKSTNISLYLDKKKGLNPDSKNYVPISDEAKALKHLGSGLKPSWEPILVFRKPFKGTLVSNVLAHGTGALNIDGTRVKHASKADFEGHKKQVEAIKAKGGVRGNSWKNDSDLSGANEVTEAGRWPANLTLTHTQECVFQEEEDTSSWRCVPGCPIREMDNLSGDRPSTLTGRADPNKSHSHPGSEFNSNSTFLGERTHHSNVYADSGGASRFFQQFDGVPFRYMPKANRKEAGCGVFKVLHPTPKPVKLMQYLVRLVTPKGGLVLDPFCGSASTCHAAVLEGMNYLGIERDKESWEEATRRMSIVHEIIQEEQDAQDLYLTAMDIEVVRRS